jgi:hypothetical protein
MSNADYDQLYPPATWEAFEEIVRCSNRRASTLESAPKRLACELIQPRTRAYTGDRRAPGVDP